MSRKEFIPPTKTAPAKKIKLAAAKKEEKVPKDLEDLWAAVIAISTIHNLLQEGMFPHRYNNAIGVGVAFMGQLHKKALADCVAHPKQHLIPEIATLNAAQKVANGEAKSPTPTN